MTAVTFRLDPALDGLALARRWMETRFSGGLPERLRAWPVRVEPGLIDVACEIDPGHANFVGLVHGGVTAALIDMAGGGVAMTLLKPGETLLTTDLTLRFLNAAPIGCGRLTAQGRLISHDPRRVVAEVRVVTPDEVLVAHGTTAVSIRAPRTA